MFFRQYRSGGGGNDVSVFYACGQAFASRKKMIRRHDPRISGSYASRSHRIPPSRETCDELRSGTFTSFLRHKAVRLSDYVRARFLRCLQPHRSGWNEALTSRFHVLSNVPSRTILSSCICTHVASPCFYTFHIESSCDTLKSTNNFKASAFIPDLCSSQE